MKLASDDSTLAENKVLILYILDKIQKEITNEGLFQLVLSVEEMNYFYFQQFLLDLQENQYIVNHTQHQEPTYEITEEGKEALNLTEDLLPGIKKLKIDTTIGETLGKIKEEESITTEFVSTSEQGFMVKCKIIEQNQPIFELHVQVPSSKEAKRISDHWKLHANDIYPQIMKLLE